MTSNLHESLDGDLPRRSCNETGADGQRCGRFLSPKGWCSRHGRDPAPWSWICDECGDKVNGYCHQCPKICTRTTAWLVDEAKRKEIRQDLNYTVLPEQLDRLIDKWFPVYSNPQ